VKTYCPKCCDIYYTRNKYQGNIDGAYFGTTFPHLFLMTFSYLKPPKPTQVYTPRIFGFKIHNGSGGSSSSTAKQITHGESEQKRRQREGAQPEAEPADGAMGG